MKLWQSTGRKKGWTEYTSTLASQHSILKDQADIIKEFKNYVKQMISNDDIDIEM